VCKVISVFLPKGGTGKTFMSYHIGTGIRYFSDYLTYKGVIKDKDAKVLIIDLDTQTNISNQLIQDNQIVNKHLTIGGIIGSTLFNENFDPNSQVIEVKNDNFSNLSLIHGTNVNSDNVNVNIQTIIDLINRYPSDKRMYVIKNIVDKLKPNFDYIIIDLPPSVDIITQNCLVASDHMLMVSEPKQESVEGIQTIIKFVNDNIARFNKDLNASIVLNRCSFYNNDITDREMRQFRNIGKVLANTRIINKKAKLLTGKMIESKRISADAHNKKVPIYCVNTQSYCVAYNPSDLMRDIITEFLTILHEKDNVS